MWEMAFQAEGTSRAKPRGDREQGWHMEVQMAQSEEREPKAEGGEMRTGGLGQMVESG